MSRRPLTESELAEALESLENWYVEDGKLATRRRLPTFPGAIAFVQQVADLAEELQHHPDIDIRWRTVTLAVNTHDAGNVITASDVELARRVDGLAAS